MIRCRGGEQCVLPKFFKCNNIGIITSTYEFPNFIFKSYSPVIGLGRIVSPRIGVEIVHNIATADNKHAVFSE